MCESLEQRVSELERVLGLLHADDADQSTTSLDVTPIKNRLRDLQLDFIFDQPLGKLHKLRRVFNEGIDVPLKDKIRTVNFSSGLMQKRAKLLEDIDRTSKIVFESSSFQNAENHLPGLEKVEENVKIALNIVTNFDTNFMEFYDELRLVLRDLRFQVDDLERNIVEVEKLETSKA